MKKIKVMIAGCFALLFLSSSVYAQSNKIEIPKGTKVTRIDKTKVKIKLPKGYYYSADNGEKLYKTNYDYWLWMYRFS
ncbi:MAG: hypothetical protein QM539_08050 [Alphaproteobacteria bacterium]|nr:hypothetical protein [Alphaproteobacteria bacterium]